MSIFQASDACGIDAQRYCHVKKVKCPVCGETFYADTGLWAYRIAENNQCVCSYGCMRKRAKEKEARAAEIASAREQRAKARAAAHCKKQCQERRALTKRRLEEIAMKIDWKKPDRDKETGEKLTVAKIATFLVKVGTCADQASAFRYIRRKVPDESYYQEKILDALRKRAEAEGLKHKVWKAAQGQFSQSGISDVLAIIGGVFFAVEVKRPLMGELSKLQEAYINDVNNAGGVACTAIYPEDLDEIWARAAEIRGNRNEERVQVRNCEV